MDEIIKIDIDQVLRQRLNKYHRFIPKFIINWLKHTICQDELNEILKNNHGKTGVEFCRGTLQDLGVTYDVEGELPKDGRFIITSNHPLGGLDGLILSDFVSKSYNDEREIRFVVNDLLTFIDPLKSMFLGVNKHGKQSRDASMMLERAFASDCQILMFPAGLVSRKGDDGTIKDLRWHKMAIQKAISSKRDIIPLYFSGQNSNFFYKFARLRTKIGLKFNIEMIYLPQEIFRRNSYHFNIVIGKPIKWEDLRGGTNAQEEADRLRELVYGLKCR
ncbi:MAG: 1-acyl-sn-glycerol-3-phosphate acyltransferase [Muribaculum sp.]|nr:1-acyl-sn-glycerol-3-phosphate acyltransferase [Muribaculum sp.]